MREIFAINISVSQQQKNNDLTAKMRRRSCSRGHQRFWNSDLLLRYRL